MSFNQRITKIRLRDRESVPPWLFLRLALCLTFVKVTFIYEDGAVYEKLPPQEFASAGPEISPDRPSTFPDRPSISPRRPSVSPGRWSNIPPQQFCPVRSPERRFPAFSAPLLTKYLAPGKSPVSRYDVWSLAAATNLFFLLRFVLYLLLFKP